MKNKKLLVIFGPPAVGKLTVAKTLAKITDFRVFHNHMVDDLIKNFFSHGSSQLNTLSAEFRKRIIEECIKADMNLIFTYFWKFDLERGKKNIDIYKKVVEANGGQVFFVELYAPLRNRLNRAEMEDRRKSKMAVGAETVAEIEKNHVTNTNGDFFYKENYLYIDNTDLSPEKTASKIKEHFNFL
ncbi:hypothetical protein A2914_01425 [Candidatus Nomurabacteria bacterium RIFCSPLOWO2_01_FULL_41_21]|uniref:Shikimate kinase n=2 Tax=Candidatus Nomuraibacteriota TaxID=1752729 RepID=A0A1F6X1G7_9BACT|nr:MAG: hypothetical protein A2647_03975 [Candidatus Nomurabacteria bacterium RIFCSPHIGHO2_01_FULL_40_24b]OGI87967.1 MAG: hypothetical protein A2914_01425 [Candidatus Nomurabacteria bacterium RIFCSPLOWO2_01_FULL_41_21]